MNALAIIPARGGSKGLPSKNILPLCGRPLIAYTIEAARASRLCNRVVCSTDDARIAAVAAEEGLEVIHRPAELAGDNSPIEEVLRHAIAHVEADGRYRPDLVALLYANVPVRAEGIVDRALRLLAETEADAVITVEDVGRRHPNWMVTIGEDRRIGYYVPGCIYRRQDLPACYVHDGAVSAIKRDVIMTPRPKTTLYHWLGEDIRALVQRPHDTVDVDDRLDMIVAEAILRSRQGALT